MAYKNIKAVFDEVCGNIRIDTAFYQKVCAMESSFVNKKQEHLEFFGGSLTGVQVVRFTDADRDKVFSSLLHADDVDLETKIFGIVNKDGKPVIDKNWVRASDVFNIACIWIMHAIHNSRQLNEQERTEAKIRVCSYLLYKYLTSLLAHYFKYPADPEIAQATYAQLSFRYALKQYGSWGAMLRNMAENTVAKSSVHYDTIANMDIDTAVVYFITDTQGRIRDVMKNIYSEFVKAHSQGNRIAKSSSLVEADGELILKDSVKSPGVYARYLKSIIADKNTFYKQELVDVVVSIMHTMSPRLFTKTLEWTSEHYQGKQDDQIDKAVDIVMEHAIEYMSANIAMSRNTDIANMVDKLRGAYMSSRSTDLKLLEARKLVEKMVIQATGSKNESGVAAVRTAWMLYIVTRAFARRYYIGH